MRRALASLVLVVVIAVSVIALDTDSTRVAGTWTFCVHDQSVSLVLSQDGKTVTGILQNPHGGPFHLKGEFVAGQLKLSGSSEGLDPIAIFVTGAIKADGSLAGSLNSHIGDMTWTAVRSEAK